LKADFDWPASSSSSVSGTARQAMKAIAFSTEPDEPGKTRIERLQKVSDEKEFAESELALATRPFVPPDLELTWQELQAALPERTAFVDFVQFIHHASPEKHRGRLVRQRRMLAFILKKTGAQLWIQHDFVGNAKLKKSPEFYE
jgi:hypothetical protein